MFDKTIKKLASLKTFGVPIATDERGYLDRECPSETCLFAFKINEDDWLDRWPADGEGDRPVWCPLCGHQAPWNKWWTQAQVDEGKKQAVALLRSEIFNALADDADAFNSQQPRGGLIRISMRVARRPVHVVIPVAAAALLDQTLVCKECSVRYAVRGSAFFCPACGYNCVESMFAGTLANVRAKIDNIETLRTALAAANDRDVAETVVRSIVESCVLDCVVAFQHLAERLYEPFSKQSPPPANVFQRLGEGSKLWRGILGKGYEDWLAPDELRVLRVMYQRRHLLAHREGIVDERYRQNSGDTTYSVGQRIVVSTTDATSIATSVEKLGTALREAVKSHV